MLTLYASVVPPGTLQIACDTQPPSGLQSWQQYVIPIGCSGGVLAGHESAHSDTSNGQIKKDLTFSIVKDALWAQTATHHIHSWSHFVILKRSQESSPLVLPSLSSLYCCCFYASCRRKRLPRKSKHLNLVVRHSHTFQRSKGFCCPM